MSKLFIHIGTITGVFGIKGELKVKFLLTKPKKIIDQNLIFIEKIKKKIKIKFIRAHKNYTIIKFDNINNRNKAELLINKKLLINKNKLPALSKNEYYPDDLIGFVVQTINGKTLGLVKKIFNFVAGDLLEIYSNKKFFFLPFDKNNIKKIDKKNKKIISKPMKGIVLNK